MHDKGRVFYTSMGHREDVWENPKYQGLLLGALGWITGQTELDVSQHQESHSGIRQVAGPKVIRPSIFH